MRTYHYEVDDSARRGVVNTVTVILRPAPDSADHSWAATRCSCGQMDMSSPADDRYCPHVTRARMRNWCDRMGVQLADVVEERDGNTLPVKSDD